MIELYNTETRALETFKGVDEVLEMINSDRSEEWTDYNADDWREGLEFTSYQLPLIYARARKELLREGLIPSSSPPLKPSVWKLLVFLLPVEDREDEDGYNMLLENPINGEAVRVNSIDFDFEV